MRAPTAQIAAEVTRTITVIWNSLGRSLVAVNCSKNLPVRSFTSALIGYRFAPRAKKLCHRPEASVVALVHFSGVVSVPHVVRKWTSKENGDATELLGFLRSMEEIVGRVFLF